MTTLNRQFNGYNVIEYLNKNIIIIENVLKSEICDELKKMIDIIPKIKKTYEDGNNVKCHMASINNLLEINDESFYSFSTDNSEYETLLKNANNNNFHTNALNGLTQEYLKKCKNHMDCAFETASNVIGSFNNKYKLFGNTGFELRKIYGATKLHSDGINQIEYKKDIWFIKNQTIGDKKMIRNMSFILHLNDDYEGGLFKFPLHDVEVKLKKGSVIIFPPYWTHPHCVSELENNTYRYTINTWGCEFIEYI
jgi:hypothetical protein